MSLSEPHRAARAVAVAAVGVPAALFGHLLVTGAPAGPSAAVIAALAVVLVALAVPARSMPGLALVTAATQLAAHSVLAALPATGGPGSAPACIPAVGRAASLGLHLAVLRADGGCPVGSLAVGVTTSAALAAAGTALAILAGNAGVAVLTGLLLRPAFDAGALVTALVSVVERAVARAAALRARCETPAPVPTATPRAPARDRMRRARPVTRWTPGAAVLRGPPGAAALAR